MSSQIPLGEVAEFINGRAFKPSDWGFNGLPIIRIQNLTNEEAAFNYYDKDVEEKYYVKDGDVLISWSATLDVFIWNRSDAILNQHIFRAVPDTSKISKKFLFYALKHVMDKLRAQTHGATMKHITRKPFEQTKIYLPPLPEQERIVRLLDEAESLRATRARANARMEQLVPALFQEMFGDPVANPKKWEIVLTEKTFSQTKAGTKCGPFGSALKKNEYVNSGIPVWGIDNVQENEFIEENSLFITQEKFEELSSYGVEAGDILISRAGTVGRMCVAYPKQSPSIIGTNLIRLSFDRNQVVPEYFTAMAMYFSNSLGNLRANADESAYSFVSTKTLKSLLIPVPPLALQREFAARVEEARGVQAAQGKSAEKIEALYQSMLSRAFQPDLGIL